MSNANFFSLLIIIILAITAISAFNGYLNHKRRIEQIKSFELRSEKETQRLEMVIQALSSPADKP